MLPEKTENRPVYVIGHQNPDTDAICSAIGNAEFLRTHAENILGIGKGRSAGADTDS